MLADESTATAGGRAIRAAAEPRPERSRWSLSEVVLLLVLAAVQFTLVIDFVLIMPLGPMIEEGLTLTDHRQFSWIVSTYAFSASLTGLLAAYCLDRFDRKRSLLVLYVGFAAGTLLCAFAPNYPVLLLGRAVAGAFAGVLGANVLAIVGDVFPYERRGTAMGVIMSSFSVASIVGIPAAIVLANYTHLWQTPFTVLGVLCFPVLLVAWRVLPPLRGHLQGRHGAGSSLREVMLHGNHLRAYALSGALVLSSFVVFPFLTIYLVNNVHLTMDEVPLIWVCGGLATLLTTTPIGVLADLWGKLTVFRVLALACVVPVLVLTNLPAIGLVITLLVTTTFMLVGSGRMVPAVAMITSSALPRLRGSFMSVNAAVQYFVMGLAPIVAGLIVGVSPEGQAEAHEVRNYPLVGLVSAAAMVASVFLAGRLRRAEDAP
jgi:predicted MFS family arabinose efflux permease